MAKDASKAAPSSSRGLLGEFGPDTPKTQAPVATNGGEVPVRAPMNYSPPVGPIFPPASVGLHGENFGQAKGGMGIEPGQSSGKPGIGGTVYMCGSQGSGKGKS